MPIPNYVAGNPWTIEDEVKFRSWYEPIARRTGLDLNPDSPYHQYDYRAAYLGNALPKVIPEDRLPHWPSEYKMPGHPNRFVNGVDTISESRMMPNLGNATGISTNKSLLNRLVELFHK
jgi:hypothetical protein